MGKRRPSRKMFIEIDVLSGQARVIDNYTEIIESDAQTVFEKLGIDAKEWFKRLGLL